MVQCLVYRLIEMEPKSFNLLPYTYVDNALAIYFDFDAYVGSINLIYKEVFDLVNDTPAPGDVMSFKVVIFEGIPLATLKTMVDIRIIMQSPHCLVLIKYPVIFNDSAMNQKMNLSERSARLRIAEINAQAG